jgi:hypothetical protein
MKIIFKPEKSERKGLSDERVKTTSKMKLSELKSILLDHRTLAQGLGGSEL